MRQLCVEREGGAEQSHGVSEGDYISFRPYVDTVDTPGLPEAYDFVCIDGRARLGAALKALPYLTEVSVVVIHDAVRKRYDAVDQYFEVVEEVMDNGQPALTKNGLKIIQRRSDLPPGTWPLSPEQIDGAYAAIHDIEA